MPEPRMMKEGEGGLWKATRRGLVERWYTEGFLALCLEAELTVLCGVVGGAGHLSASLLG